jgi:toxin-antitoxin system PIN domain toxin
VQAVDTNVLVYAAIESSLHHERALAVLRGLAEGARPWALPWPCIYEFFRVVTHPRVFHPPMPGERALAFLRALRASPSVHLLAESSRHPELMESVLRAANVSGNLAHDAHIAALCLEHGVTEIVTGDRDFSRFEGLTVTHPF